ncbi:MAG: hypothetical protein U0075_06885 [Thermomicrobiales bacterium]
MQHIGIGWSGGFGEYSKAPAKNVFPLPDHVSYEDASLLDVLAVGVHAINVTGIHTGSTVLVFGGGALALPLPMRPSGPVRRWLPWQPVAGWAGSSRWRLELMSPSTAHRRT